jgi:hypothetical protein
VALRGHTRFEFSQAVAHQILSHYSVSPFLREQGFTTVSCRMPTVRRTAYDKGRGHRHSRYFGRAAYHFSRASADQSANGDTRTMFSKRTFVAFCFSSFTLFGAVPQDQSDQQTTPAGPIQRLDIEERTTAGTGIRFTVISKARASLTKARTRRPCRLK